MVDIYFACSTILDGFHLIEVTVSIKCNCMQFSFQVLKEKKTTTEEDITKQQQYA